MPAPLTGHSTQSWAQYSINTVDVRPEVKDDKARKEEEEEEEEKQQQQQQQQQSWPAIDDTVSTGQQRPRKRS